MTAALAHRLSVITGGPGTGKTSSIKSIAAAAELRGAKVLLVAPTGRAAVRMTQSGGLKASTVHSALQWIPGEGPGRDRHDPLQCDLLIVDETSMANLELLVMLLRAVGGDTHVALVGDADQLAPVGAGKPFAELVASERVPTTRLTHIFRQAAGSMIVQGAHAIRRGELPEFAVADGMRRDLFMIERPNAGAALAEIVSLVSDRLPTHYEVDPVRDIQVFAPVYRGELGIDAINAAVRAALNPDGKPVRGGRLRIGDKLMMTGRNLHELGLMNGTLLRLLDEVAGGDPNEDDEDDESRDGRRAGFAVTIPATARRQAAPRRSRADPGGRRRRLPARARGVRQPPAGLRLLGPSRPGDRAADRRDRRPPRLRRLLPAPRDALHGRHPRDDRDRDRRHSRRPRPRRRDRGHRPALRAARRAPRPRAARLRSLGAVDRWRAGLPRRAPTGSTARVMQISAA